MSGVRDASTGLTEIRLKKAEKRLEIEFDDGQAVRPAGGVPARRKPVGRGAGPRPEPEADRRPAGAMSASSELEPVGNYAVRIKFDDLHDTGIYSWQYLRFLGENRDRLWA